MNHRRRIRARQRCDNLTRLHELKGGEADDVTIDGGVAIHGGVTDKERSTGSGGSSFNRGFV